MALPEIIKELLESGVHFGHLSKHWNPRMKRFIFGKKKDVYIIDLEKTALKLAEAKEFVKECAANGEKVLFVATKKQLRDIIKDLAKSCEMPYMVEKWVGGLLTNFPTVHKRIKKYVDFMEKRDKGEFDKIPRKAVVRLNRELKRMDKNYNGVVGLDDLPDCIFVIDPKKETACVREAQRLSVPIVALIDTDADPTAIDYPIPGNDDAIKSVRYITSAIADAIKEGLKKAQVAAEVKKISDEAKAKESETVNGEVLEKAAAEEEAGEKGTLKKRLRQKEG